MEKKIELNRIRDFSEVFADAVTFLKENYKILGKTMVMIVAPAYTIASILFSVFSIRLVGMAESWKDTGPTQQYYTPIGLLAFFLFFLALMLAVGVVFSYIYAYSKKTDGPLTTADVWSVLKTRLGKFILYAIGYGILFSIGFAIVGLIIAVISSVALVLAPLLLIMLYIVLLFLVTSYLSMLVPVIFFEDEGFIDTLSRCVRLVSGNLWQTFAINIVTVIILYVVVLTLYLVIGLPLMFIATSTNSFNADLLKIIVVCAFVIFPFIGFFLYSFQYCVISMQYFSLLEKKDYVGLRSRVENIGQTEDTKTEEDF